MERREPGHRTKVGRTALTIRLTAEGAAVRSRRVRMERVAAERRAAVDRFAEVTPGEMLSPEDVRDAILAERRGLA